MTFETAELGRKLAKHEYEAVVPELRTWLLRVQNELNRSRSFAVVVVIAGVDGAGKGDTVNVLHEWMDPRYLRAHAFGPPTTEEAERPPMWRFWRELPPRGSVGIFFGSWYTAPIIGRVLGGDGRARLDHSLERVNRFEKLLSDDGALVVKYWFHLSKEAQKRRLKRLSADPKTAWRVTEQDWRHFGLYDRFAEVSSRAISLTSTGEAPWTVVEGGDRRYREVTVARHLLTAIEGHLERQQAAKPTTTKTTRPSSPAKVAPVESTILDAVDLTRTIEPKPYERLLNRFQGELNELNRRAVSLGVSTVLVFEGWDAAGKGGAIRRINRALDARDYQVIPIAAPTAEDLARPYLWRFWRQLPRAGKLAVFDRSWYGRVLVERVEGYASEAEWHRAYKEIADFEEQLVEHGTAVIKFWLHISSDEQLARFKLREQTAFKQFKITDEDYRNRAQRADYELAVHEMVERTSTVVAPWTLIAANDKHHGRVEVLRTVCAALGAAVDRAERVRGRGRQRKRKK